jgi:hypothetical protein
MDPTQVSRKLCQRLTCVGIPHDASHVVGNGDNTITKRENVASADVVVVAFEHHEHRSCLGIPDDASPVRGCRQYAVAFWKNSNSLNGVAMATELV